MQVSGTVKVINKTQEIGKSGFTKRELVVTTSEQYPQDILVEFVKDKCELLKGLKKAQSQVLRRR